MTVSGDVGTQPARPSSPSASRWPVWLMPAVLAGIVVVGLLLRWAAMDESFYGDELFTYEIATKESLSQVLDLVRSDIEISPPLFFVAAWTLGHLGDPFVWLRMASLAAGTVVIVLTYFLGARCVSRPAGLVAAALMSLSPMGIFYSTEARAYSLMLMLVLASTLTLLRGLDRSRWPWWVTLSILYAAAMYTHYMAVFALIAQTGWALWTRRDRWLPLALSVVGAALLFLPWVPSFVADTRSPAQRVVSLFVPFDATTVVQQSVRLTVGAPFAPLNVVPGTPALIVFGIGALLAGITWLVTRRWRLRLTSGAGLIVVLALAAPVGAALFSLFFDKNLFVARNLQVSLPALYVALAAAVVAGWPRRTALVALVLVIAGMGWSAGRTFDPDSQRPPMRQIADYLAARSTPGDLVAQITWFSGIPARSLDVQLPPDLPTIHVSSTEPIPDQPSGKVFVVGTAADTENAASLLPRDYVRTDTYTWPDYYLDGPGALTIVTFEPRDQARSRTGG